MMPNNNLRFVPLAMLITAAAVYGLVFPFNAMAAGAGAGYFGHAFWQTFIAGVGLLIASRVSGQSLPVHWRAIRAYIVVGAFGFGLPMALLTYVAPHLPAGTVSLVLALSPACTYLGSVFVRLDKLSMWGLGGIALGFAGVVIVVAPEGAIPGPQAAEWFLIALIAPVFLGIANISALTLRPPETTSLVVGTGFMLGAAVSILPLMVISGQSYLPTGTDLIIPTLGAAAVNGLFIVMFAEIVRRYGPTFFAQFNYLAVVAAIIWSAIIFREAPTAYLLTALALMAGGVFVSELRHRSHPNTA